MILKEKNKVIEKADELANTIRKFVIEDREPSDDDCRQMGLAFADIFSGIVSLLVDISKNLNQLRLK